MPEKIFLLQVIIGPPIGLNLRNIYWHGFVSEEEFDEAYLSLLVVVMASIAKEFRLRHNGGYVRLRPPPLTHRLHFPPKL
jgi:hypothetical protein